MASDDASDNHRLLKVDQAARAVGYSSQTVRNWVRDGHIKGFLPGLRSDGLMVDVVELRRYLATRPRPRRSARSNRPYYGERARIVRAYRADDHDDEARA